MAASSAYGYGPFIISDITNYCHQDDLEALLRRRFPATTEQPKPWEIRTDNTGAFRVWAPAVITEEEKKELYRLNDGRRGVQENILSMRVYR